MTRKESSDVCSARGLKELADLGDDHVRVFDLPGDPDLHVVDKEREAPGIAGLGECAGDLKTRWALHGATLLGLSTRGPRHGSVKRFGDVNPLIKQEFEGQRRADRDEVPFQQTGF
jgi:hypothetical protein